MHYLVVLTDFHLSKDLSTSTKARHNTSSSPGTEGYRAPEYIKLLDEIEQGKSTDRSFTEKIDMYSLGILGTMLIEPIRIEFIKPIIIQVEELF